jgi:hypothetical protein
VFADSPGALQRARQKLEAFARTPDKHARYGAKVLLKFKLQEFGRLPRADFLRWASGVPYLHTLHQNHGGGSLLQEWLEQMLADLVRTGALADDGETIEDVAN